MLLSFFLCKYVHALDMILSNYTVCVLDLLGLFCSDENKKGKDASEQQKEEPNFELSGKLTEFTNTYKVQFSKFCNMNSFLNKNEG